MGMNFIEMTEEELSSRLISETDENIKEFCKYIEISHLCKVGES